MQENIIMSKTELSRIEIVQQVLSKRLKQTEAAKTMRISYRQINRIVSNVKKYGSHAIIHKNRGKSSKSKLPSDLVKEIICIYEQLYPDFGPTFACEKLYENHDISISKESLRKILIQHSIPYPTRKTYSAQCHLWRERKHHIGELIQIDGSHHKWLFPNSEQEFCLIASIDDATGTIFAKFYEYEGTFPILDFSKCFINKFGIPLAMYLDRHSTYKTNRHASVDEELRSIDPETQFQRVMRSIGIETIHARSPQAKGRIERLFLTLQDRLIKEMKLRSISSIAEANAFLDEFLPLFNSKFSKAPKQPASFFKPVPKDFDYKRTFSIQFERTIAPDFTIRFFNRLFRLINPSIALKRRKVIVQQALDGSIRISTKDRIITVSEITEQDLETAKRNRKQLEKLAKEFAYNKSKKSWMDKRYLIQSYSFYT